MVSKILGTTKLGENFRITVPHKVRKILDVKASETLVYYNENDEIIIRKA